MAAEADEGKKAVDGSSFFYHFHQLPEGLDWEKLAKGEGTQEDAKALLAKTTLWAPQPTTDPLDLLVGKWQGPGKMGPIPIEKTNFNDFERENGVPEIHFIDFFDFQRESFHPATVRYTQRVIGTSPAAYAGQLIHSECGFFRWFPDPHTVPRKFEFEQVRAVGRGITTISQGNRPDPFSDPEAKLEFDMQTGSQGGSAENTYSSIQGGHDQNGDAAERDPRGFGIALSTTNLWRVTKDDVLQYRLTIEVQNPEVVFDNEGDSKTAAHFNRFIESFDMHRVPDSVPEPRGRPFDTVDGGHMGGIFGCGAIQPK